MEYMFLINVREYRRGNQKKEIQRNWQHRLHKTKKNKAKTQHNMCWTPLYTIKCIMTILIKTITSVLNVFTFIIKSITAHPFRLLSDSQ